MAFLNKGLEIVVRDERPKAAEIIEAVNDDTVSNAIDVTGPDALRAPTPAAWSGASSTTAGWSTSSST